MLDYILYFVCCISIGVFILSLFGDNDRRWVINTYVRIAEKNFLEIINFVLIVNMRGLKIKTKRRERTIINIVETKRNVEDSIKYMFGIFIAMFVYLIADILTDDK